MLKFDEVELSDQKVKVKGPLEGDPGLADRIKHLVFMVGQTGVPPTHAHASDWTPNGWTGAAPDTGFQAGSAYATGVAVLLGQGPSPTYETYTWSHEVKITKGDASGGPEDDQHDHDS